MKLGVYPFSLQPREPERTAGVRRFGGHSNERMYNRVRRRHDAPLIGERVTTLWRSATEGGDEHVVSRRHAECHAVRKMKEGPSESAL
jgi:hypothetical protein